MPGALGRRALLRRRRGAGFRAGHGARLDEHQHLHGQHSRHRQAQQERPVRAGRVQGSRLALPGPQAAQRPDHHAGEDHHGAAVVGDQEVPHQPHDDDQPHERPEAEPGDVSQVPFVDRLEGGLVEADAQQQERAGDARQHEGAHRDRRGRGHDPRAGLEGRAGQGGEHHACDRAGGEQEELGQAPSPAGELHGHQHGAGHEAEEEGAHRLRMLRDEAADGTGDGEHRRGHADQQRDHQDPRDGAQVGAHPGEAVRAGEQAPRRGGHLVAGVDQLVVDPGDQRDRAAADTGHGLDHADQGTAQQIADGVAVPREHRGALRGGGGSGFRHGGQPTERFLEARSAPCPAPRSRRAGSAPSAPVRGHVPGDAGVV